MTIQRCAYFWTLRSTPLTCRSGKPPAALPAYPLRPGALCSPRGSRRTVARTSHSCMPSPGSLWRERVTSHICQGDHWEGPVFRAPEGIRGGCLRGIPSLPPPSSLHISQHRVRGPRAGPVCADAQLLIGWMPLVWAQVGGNIGRTWLLGWRRTGACRREALEASSAGQWPWEGELCTHG